MVRITMLVTPASNICGGEIQDALKIKFFTVRGRKPIKAFDVLAGTVVYIKPEKLMSQRHRLIDKGETLCILRLIAKGIKEERRISEL